MRPTPQWSIRWNPDQGWEVIGPKPKSKKLDSMAFHVVVPLYLGEHWAKQRLLKLREDIVREISRGREIISEDYNGGFEEERTEQMSKWLDKLEQRFKPTSGEYADIAHGIYPGPWGYHE